MMCVPGRSNRDPDGTVWIVYEGARRRVIGDDSYAALFLRPSDAQPIEAAELAAIPEGWPVGNPLPTPGSYRSCCFRYWAVCCCGFGIPAGGPWHTHAWNLLALILTTTIVLKVYYVLLFPWCPMARMLWVTTLQPRALVEEGLLTPTQLRHHHDGFCVLLSHRGDIRRDRYPPPCRQGCPDRARRGHRHLRGADHPTVVRGARGAAAGAVALLSPVWLYSAEVDCL